MAGQIALGGFVVLGVAMSALVRFPRYANPATGLGLLAVSAAVMVAAIVHVA